MTDSAELPTANPYGSFSISSRRLEGGILIALSGEIDLNTATTIEDELGRAEQSESRIVLDLAEVSFMDSTGLRTVISADQRLRARGGSLRITNVPPQVSRLFKLVGMNDHLKIEKAQPPVTSLSGEDGSVSPD